MHDQRDLVVRVHGDHHAGLLGKGGPVGVRLVEDLAHPDVAQARADDGVARVAVGDAKVGARRAARRDDVPARRPRPSWRQRLI